jgi:hypothetical protein
MRRPVEQPDAEVLLELAHQAAYRAGSDAQPFGRARETQLAGCLDKTSKPIQRRKITTHSLAMF